VLLGIDVLLHLRDNADTVQGIARALLVSPHDVQRVVELLLADELVSGAQAAFQPGSSLAYYAVTPKGREKTAHILDHYATQLSSGPPTMTVAERFLFALAGGRPSAQREALLRLLDTLPHETDSYRRKHARALTKEALKYAARALEADEHGEVAAAGLRSIPFMDEEDAEYIAQRLRQQYAPALASDELRKVVEHAAAVCDASDGLRVLTSADRSTFPPVSKLRVIDPDAYMNVAEQTAETMKAAVLPLALDLYAEADAIIKRLPWLPPGSVSQG
jgi:DNA-binding MarR family transcriptional regulator